MKPRQAYEKYRIPENLQMHMLRVASVSKIVVDNWISGGLDKEAVVRACLLHDIAKPATFDLKKQAAFGMSGADIQKLEDLLKRLKAEYGESEHKIAVGICGEIGVNPKVAHIVANTEWSLIPLLIQKKDLESLVAIYCDMRVSPKGVMPLSDRLGELENRTGQCGFTENGTALEKIMKDNVAINLEDIVDEVVRRNIEELENISL